MPRRLDPALRRCAHGVAQEGAVRDDAADEGADAAGRAAEGELALLDPDLEAGGEVFGEGFERGGGGVVVKVGEDDEEGLVGVVGPGAGFEACWRGMLVW